MNTSTLYTRYADSRSRSGFSLIEVVLAIGIFLVTVLALVGLLGPTLQSVDEVEKTDEISSVVNTVNAFLQSSPEIKTATDSKFDAIYKSVALDGYATAFVYRYYQDPAVEDAPPVVRLEVGFAEDEPVGANAIINEPASNLASFADAAGPIYRVVLTPSSVLPLVYHDETTTDVDGKPIPERNDDNVYELKALYTNATTGLEQYLEGYFALEVRIFVEDPGPTFTAVRTLDYFKDREPIFTYNTAVVR